MSAASNPVADPAMSVGLSRMTVGMPSGSESVDDILARNDRPANERRLFTKVYKLQLSPTLAEGETMEALLVRTGQRALRETGTDGAQLVLYGHTLLSQQFAYGGGFADRLRAGLGLPGARFFGLSHIACTSVLRAVVTARRFLHRPGAAADESVLVLGGDHGSVVDSARIVPWMTVGGDAAVAFRIRRAGGRYRWLGAASGRDDRFHRSLRMTPEELRLFGQVCAANVIAAMDAALAEAGLGRDDVAWVLPHLSNAMFWRTVSAKSGIPLEKFCLDLIAEQGHTFGVDALLALAHADGAGQLLPGQRCLLVSLGQGSYVQAVVIEVAATEEEEDAR